MLLLLLLLLMRDQLSLQLMLSLILPCDQLGLQDLELPNLFGGSGGLQLRLSLSLSLSSGGLLLSTPTILVGDGGELKHAYFFRRESSQPCNCLVESPTVEPSEVLRLRNLLIQSVVHHDLSRWLRWNVRSAVEEGMWLLLL